MLKIRYILRLLSAYLKRFKALILIGVIFGVLAFFFFRYVGPIFWGRNVERIGVSGRYQTDTLPVSILEFAGDGLTTINDSGVVEPNLATSWETPDGGQTWIFHLREDVSWQDGKKLTSNDINYNFSDVEVERPDESTIVFKLAESFSPFPSVVSRPVFKQGLLGTDDWEVTKASLAGSYVQTLVLENKERDRKIYKFYPTEERAKLAFKLGEVDLLEDVFTNEPFDNWGTASVQKEIKTGQVATLFFNTESGPLTEKSFRQALNYAIDKKSLGGERALSPINPDSWAYNPQVKRYDYDPERASELVGDVEDQEIDLKLVSSPVLLDVAEKIADDWRELGLNVHVQVSSVTPTEYQAYLAIFDIPNDPDQYSMWHSTQEATNISRYKSPRIDKLLEDGRVELNMDTRREIYLDFQRFILEDLPAAFLYYPEVYDVKRN